MGFASAAYRIKTPRLFLRCWEPVDAPLLKAAVDDSRKHLIPWMPWARGDPEPVEKVAGRIRNYRSHFDQGKDFGYGIFKLDASQVLGETGLHPRVGEGGIEIGYWIHVDYIGQGFATETSAALTRVAFEVLGVDRVEIHCAPDNKASAAIPRKLGFTHEATLRRRTRFAKNDWRDSMIWTLFASDYPSSPLAGLPIEVLGIAGNRILGP